MKILKDCFGNSVKLTDERLNHIHDHREMIGMGNEIENALLHPQFVRCSKSDSDAKLFYRFYTQTVLGGKWMCVVVKYAPNSAFVVTAYLTDKLKAGEQLWPAK